MLTSFKLLRPWSWIKNVFIFIPIFFAGEIFEKDVLSAVICAFVAFCMLASSVYILNDIMDRDQDGKHEIKKNRPIASGEVSIAGSIVLLFVLFVTAIVVVTLYIPESRPLFLIYFLLSSAYSLYLKHIVVVDILVVSAFYTIRIMIGGLAAQVPVSHWLLLCTIFVSLFLIIGKRLAESERQDKRKVLEEYTPDFLRALLICAATLSVISYSLYAVLALNSNLAVFSVFFALMGIMRYMYLIFMTRQAEYPERALFKDKLILTSGILWVCFMYIIFYQYT